MVFIKTTWVDDAPPDLTAAQLNRMEDGIEEALALASDGATPPEEPPAATNEAWRVVGAAGQPGFQSPWESYGQGADEGNSTVRFRKDARGAVVFAGLVRATGTHTTNSTIFTLPAGYWPDKRVRVPVYYETPVAQRGFGRLDVFTTGEVKIVDVIAGAAVYGGASAFFSIDGISFFPAGT